MPIRLAKFLSDNGVASRRDAEKLIESGAVAVNGDIIKTPVFFVDGGEKITVNGRPVAADNAVDIIAFHKPVNVMTTARDPDGRKTVYDLLPAAYKNYKYVGRLDYKTSGLLLLTNSGELARKLTLPATGLKRVYIATLRAKSIKEINQSKTAHSAVIPSQDGIQARAAMDPGLRRGDEAQKTINAVRHFLSPTAADDDIFNVLRRGAIIDGTHYAPMEIEVLTRYPLTVKITLTEGKKNEIRIALDSIALPVKKLHRVSYGSVLLDNIPAGNFRALTKKEIDRIAKI